MQFFLILLLDCYFWFYIEKKNSRGCASNTFIVKCSSLKIYTQFIWQNLQLSLMLCEIIKVKGYLRYKTINPQNLLSQVQVKIFFYFVEPVTNPNLWCHDEYQYMRQGAFLNISFEPQLIKSPNLTNW